MLDNKNTSYSLSPEPPHKKRFSKIIIIINESYILRTYFYFHVLYDYSNLGTLFCFTLCTHLPHIIITEKVCSSSSPHHLVCTYWNDDNNLKSLLFPPESTLKRSNLSDALCRASATCQYTCLTIKHSCYFCYQLWYCRNMANNKSS